MNKFYNSVQVFYSKPIEVRNGWIVERKMTNKQAQQMWNTSILFALSCD